MQTVDPPPEADAADAATVSGTAVASATTAATGMSDHGLNLGCSPL
ncbi:MAG TPA: hypothetical protein VGP36_07585 [Mycobacteriales bacterium]|jgi:hypothetical protein|nr:hypothetical protein [Mycobacteriales bacterium]